MSRSKEKKAQTLTRGPISAQKPAGGTLVPSEALELLTGDYPLDQEYRRKLEYCAIEVDRPQRDPLDISGLRTTMKDLIRQKQALLDRVAR